MPHALVYIQLPDLHGCKLPTFAFAFPIWQPFHDQLSVAFCHFHSQRRMGIPLVMNQLGIMAPAVVTGSPVQERPGAFNHTRAKTSAMRISSYRQATRTTQYSRQRPVAQSPPYSHAWFPTSPSEYVYEPFGESTNDKTSRFSCINPALAYLTQKVSLPRIVALNASLSHDGDAWFRQLYLLSRHPCDAQPVSHLFPTSHGWGLLLPT